MVSAILDRVLRRSFTTAKRICYSYIHNITAICSVSTSSNPIVDSVKESDGETETEIVFPKENKPHKKKVRGSTQPTELKRYISSFPFLVNTPTNKKLFRVQRNPPDSVYLIDENVASLFSEKLVEENLDPEATVIEINPGYGILTSELKNKLGFKKINCFEDDFKMGESLVSKFKSDINWIHTNFIALPRLHHMDQIDGGSRIDTTLKHLQNNHNKDKNNKLYIIGATPVNSPVNFAMKSLIHQKFVFDEDWDWDVTYYLALGSKPYVVLTSSPDSGFTEYRQSSVNFQLFFKHTSLGSLPRKAFLPWQSEIPNDKSEDSRAQIRHDPNIVQLIKFKPNTEVITKVGKDGLILLWYFVRHHLYSRKSAVIPELEQWIPGCGPRLIRNGYTIYTQFGSLPPDKILELFLEFSSWPEFKSCSFISAVEKFISKIGSTEDDA